VIPSTKASFASILRLQTIGRLGASQLARGDFGQSGKVEGHADKTIAAIRQSKRPFNLRSVGASLTSHASTT